MRGQRPVVLVACVAEDRPDWHNRAFNLALSCLSAPSSADIEVLTCFVDSVDKAAARRISDLGAHVEVVKRVDANNPYLNKLRMLECAETTQADMLAALDCDTIVVGDVARYLTTDAVAAKPADVDRLTPDQWRQLFATLGLPQPTTRYVATSTGQEMGPYFNSGVLLVPRRFCRVLNEGWTEMNRRVSDLYQTHPHIVPPQWRFHLDQYALTAALVSTRLPVRALPIELNYPTHIRVQGDALTGIDPVILHYHKDVTPSGFLTRSQNAEVNRHLDAFNRRRADALGVRYGRLPRPRVRVRARRRLTHARRRLVRASGWGQP